MRCHSRASSACFDKILNTSCALISSHVCVCVCVSCLLLQRGERLIYMQKRGQLCVSMWRFRVLVRMNAVLELFNVSVFNAHMVYGLA